MPGMPRSPTIPIARDMHGALRPRVNILPGLKAESAFGPVMRPTRLSVHHRPRTRARVLVFAARLAPGPASRRHVALRPRSTRAGGLASTMQQKFAIVQAAAAGERCNELQRPGSVSAP